ncbi:unnamed protein product [Caenorhabditis angaria]|uniref:Domain of unknown function WSN domain-containing protein n=1 Tax=Caenorhabditis angaria TaxID=860376 RepID=A0A9P1N572_9PELO|nr:unnamed protein product [Caenorhabditis angaria]
MKFLILVIIIIIFMTVDCRSAKNSIEEEEEHDQKQNWHRIHQDQHQNHWDHQVLRTILHQHQYQQDHKNLEHLNSEDQSEDLSQEYENFFEDLEIDSADSQEETSEEQNLEVAKEIVDSLENLAYDELSAEFPILLIPGVQGVVLGMVNLLIVDNVLPEIVREGKDFFDILRNVRNTIYGIDMDEENAEKNVATFSKTQGAYNEIDERVYDYNESDAESESCGMADS